MTSAANNPSANARILISSINFFISFLLNEIHVLKKDLSGVGISLIVFEGYKFGETACYSAISAC
jgi:hypothetical protein